MKKFVDCWNRIKQLQHNPNSKIFIFGSGNSGQSLLSDFRKLGIDICAFLDNSANKVGTTIDEVDVRYAVSLKDEDKNLIFVCVSVMAMDAYVDIRHQLEGMGLTESTHFGDFGTPLDTSYYVDTFDLLGFRPNEGHDLRQKLLKRGLPRFKQGYFMPEYGAKSIVFDVINLTVNTTCSLRCKDCAFAIPYVPKPQNFNPAQIADDLDKLLSVSITPLVSLVGGEVFLHPQMNILVEELKSIKNYKNVGRFEVITNGMVLPSCDLLCSLNELTCFDVAINDYGVDDNKIDSLVELCEKSGITYRMAREVKKIWGDHGDFVTPRNWTEKEKIHLYYLCGTCCALYNGKLYTCNRAAILQENGLVEKNETDSIDIRTYADAPERMQEELFQFLYQMPHISTCDYCDGYIALPNGDSAFRQIPPAIQMANNASAPMEVIL
jgi:hypothetical protein